MKKQQEKKSEEEYVNIQNNIIATYDQEAKSRKHL
jgi:hypothetical protein